ncbi:MAG: ribonuclease D [Gammaproteobacteria bacterium]|nr:ribonuclease D [Gammaproteobacteria bacterium]
MDYQFITSNEALAEFCRQLAAGDYCAVDTEFIRERTYYPLLSLMQIANEQYMACIDPFAISDFEPLRKLFQNQQVVKVFHSPSQDLEILYQQFGEVPSPIFDTQLAAAVLGFQHQTSYADLVFEVTGTRLEKKHTRADWSKRPLSEDELDYAMDDVRYLRPVYHQMKASLDTKNRSSWITKDLLAMSRPESYEIDTSLLWQRLKGVQKLKDQQLYIAQQLCTWREQQAQQKNRPRRWIAADDWIIEISKRKPTSIDQLSSIHEIPEKVITRQGKAILNMVEQALQGDATQWPEAYKPRSLNPAQQALGDCLMGVCRMIAEDKNIAIATFATRKDIDSLILNQKSSRLAQGWRFNVAGELLLGFIHGQSNLMVKQGELRLCNDSDS